MPRYTPGRLAVEPLESRTTPATLLTPGADADAGDELLAVSTDGRYVLFASRASNLVAGATDTNNDFDLFWRDTTAGTTKLVTAQAGTLNAQGFGTGAAAIDLGRRAVLSGDGLWVAFTSAVPAATLTGDGSLLDQPNTNDVFHWSAVGGSTKLVSVRFGQNVAVGNAAGIEAFDPNVSDDGRFVAYASKLNANEIDSTDVTDDADNTLDLFRRDMAAGSPFQATATATSIPGVVEVVGKFGPVARPVGRYMSGDGLTVAFATTVGADILVGRSDRADTLDVFVRDLSATNDLVLASAAADTTAAIGNVAGLSAQGPVVSRSGSAVVFSSNAPGGGTGKALASGFVNDAAPADLYARLDPFLPAARTVLVSGVNGSATKGANGFVPLPDANGLATYAPTAAGDFVAFASAATNLVDAAADANAGGLDVFVRETGTLVTDVVSVGTDGTTGAAPSDRPSVSDDGRYVSFVSAASDLGQGVSDTNGVSDVFLRDRSLGVTRAVSVTPDGLTTGNGASTAARVSAAGTLAAYVSRATDLVAPAAKGVANVFADALPLPPLFPPEKIVVASGPDDGSTRDFGFDADGQLTSLGPAFTPFPTRPGTVRTAVGDVDGDGTTDFVYVTGPGGGSEVRVVDGRTGTDLVPSTTTFEPSFAGGLFVAVADFDADGKAEIAVSPDVGGGGRVQVFAVSGGKLVQRANFFGIDDPAFRGGARVAAGDVNADGRPELIVGAGFGGGPRVAIFNGRTLFATPGDPARLIGDFFAFPGADAVNLRNGVFVAAGDVTGDGFAELVFGGGPGGGPRVYALDGKRIATGADLATVYNNPAANFFVFDSSLRGGVRPAVKDIDGDAKLDLVAGSGEGTPSQIRTYLGSDLAASGGPVLFESFDPFGSSSLPAGVFVG